MSTTTLFDSIAMGPHRLKNRLVMNPMTRSRADADAVPTPIMANYYDQRATAGPVSYTHLDVYKRQLLAWGRDTRFDREINIVIPLFNRCNLST